MLGEQISNSSSKNIGDGARFQFSEQIEWRWSKYKVQRANLLEMERVHASASKS